MRKYGTTVHVSRRWPLMMRLKGTVIMQIWWQILLIGVYSSVVYLISKYTEWKMAYSLVRDLFFMASPPLLLSTLRARVMETALLAHVAHTSLGPWPTVPENHVSHFINMLIT